MTSVRLDQMFQSTVMKFFKSYLQISKKHPKHWKRLLIICRKLKLFWIQLYIEFLIDLYTVIMTLSSNTTDHTSTLFGSEEIIERAVVRIKI